MLLTTEKYRKESIHRWNIFSGTSSHALQRLHPVSSTSSRQRENLHPPSPVSALPLCLVKKLILLFTQNSIVVWKIVHVLRQKVQLTCIRAGWWRKLFSFLLLFCTPVVFQEFCKYWLYGLPVGSFSFAQCFVKNWILLVLSYLWTVKQTSLEFLHAYLWELLEKNKPTSLPFYSLLKVLNYS